MTPLLPHFFTAFKISKYAIAIYISVNYLNFIINVMIPANEKTALLNEEPYMVLITRLHPYVFSIARFFILEDYAVPYDELPLPIEDGKPFLDEKGDFVFAFKKVEDMVYVRKLKLVDVIKIKMVS